LGRQTAKRLGNGMVIAKRLEIWGLQKQCTSRQRLGLGIVSIRRGITELYQARIMLFFSPNNPSGDNR
jgi:hypothetical protein